MLFSIEAWSVEDQVCIDKGWSLQYAEIILWEMKENTEKVNVVSDMNSLSAELYSEVVNDGLLDEVRSILLMLQCTAPAERSLPRPK